LTPVSDEIIEDNLGSVFGKKKGNGSRTILIGGHLDEIGFMVTQIDDKGFIKFTPIGGWWSQVILSQKMTLVTDNGEYVGVVRSEEHTSELQSRFDLVCRLLLEKK